ncbi:unnamed protein product, partial [Rhizoctonia solani]
MKHWLFKIINKGGKPMIQVKNKSKCEDFVSGLFRYSFIPSNFVFLTPEEVSAVVLTKMKETAKAYLSHKVTHTVLIVPTYFNDAQHQTTKDTGSTAGLTVLCIINNPTAAAITYGLEKEGSESQIIVYNLGGGTFNVSLLSINDGVFEVLATAGDTHLGGEDFDNHVIKHFIQLKKEVEKAKHTLSSQMSTKLKIESFENGNGFFETLTCSKFEELNINLFRNTMKPVKQVLKDAGIKKEHISDVVLVGGLTHIPKVQQLIKEYFGKGPSKGINPDKAIAYGAAIQGGILSREEGVNNVILIEVCLLTLGIETQQNPRGAGSTRERHMAL